MDKTIKIKDQAYHNLDNFRDKHESFSEAVERLLAAQGVVWQLASILEGQVKFREWQKQELEKLNKG